MDGLGRAVGAGVSFEAPVLKVKEDGTFTVIAELDESGNVKRDPQTGEIVPKMKTYELSPLKLSDFGFIEQLILAKRPTADGALLPLLEKLKPTHAEMLLTVAYQDQKAGYNKVSRKELADYVDTIEGQVVTFWITLRKKHPEIDSIEKARFLFDKLGEEAQREFVRRRNLASGTDQMGNSTGQTPAAGTESQSQSTGGG